MTQFLSSFGNDHASPLLVQSVAVRSSPAIAHHSSDAAEYQEVKNPSEYFAQACLGKQILYLEVVEAEALVSMVDLALEISLSGF
jgi:hypothetical protein